MIARLAAVSEYSTNLIGNKTLTNASRQPLCRYSSTQVNCIHTLCSLIVSKETSEMYSDVIVPNNNLLFCRQVILMKLYIITSQLKW